MDATNKPDQQHIQDADNDYNCMYLLRLNTGLG